MDCEQTHSPWDPAKGSSLKRAQIIWVNSFGNLENSAGMSPLEPSPGMETLAGIIFTHLLVPSPAPLPSTPEAAGECTISPCLYNNITAPSPPQPQQCGHAQSQQAYAAQTGDTTGVCTLVAKEDFIPGLHRCETVEYTVWEITKNCGLRLRGN